MMRLSLSDHALKFSARYFPLCRSNVYKCIGQFPLLDIGYRSCKSSYLRGKAIQLVLFAGTNPAVDANIHTRISSFGRYIPHLWAHGTAFFHLILA